VASWRFRLKRAGFGATLKNSNGFSLKNSSDATVTVGTSPTTLNTKIKVAGAVKALARLAQ
jgi:hypothetical protein